MPSVFDKLNIKNHRDILVVNAPASFEKEIAALRDITVQRRLADVQSPHFVLAFVQQRAELNRVAQALLKRASGDMVLWFAYPKSTSKKYSCDFNRDNGWDLLRKAGFDSVRQVAIDADWSALRFRRLEFIAQR